MTDDLNLLASAYLDGEATAEEIAQVEADADALAEVERLRQVRAVVGHVEAPPISTREAHLAAALGAWDQLPLSERNGSQVAATSGGIDPLAAAAAGSISAPTSARRASRASRSNGWILAGAASLVVLLVGGLTLRSLTGDDDSTDDVASVQPTSTVTAATASADATTDPSLQPNEDISDPDTEADPTNDGAPPPEEGLEELSSPDDLAVFASDAVGIFPPTVDNTVEPADTAEPPVVEDAAPRESDDQATTPETPDGSTGLPLCQGADLVVGPAMYNGVLVIVGVDTSRNLALAYTSDDCALVAQAPLP